MHISHIALWTSNLERSKRFYVTYFNAVAGEPYFNAAHGYESSFLRLDSGAQIEVMNKAGLIAMVKETDNQRVGLTHVAISLGSEREVDALTQRLKSDGFFVLKEPRRTGDGFYESVVLDPDGNRIELTV